MINFFQNYSDNLFSFFLSPPDFGWLLAIKIIFIIISVLFSVYIFWGLFNTSWLELRFIINLIEFFTYRSLESHSLEKEWKKIKKRLESGLESEYKLAIIEADEIFNESLKKIGYGGEDLGAKLSKLTPDIINNLDDLKNVHQIRNNIVHDPNYHLTLEEAARVINIFEKALEDLDVF